MKDTILIDLGDTLVKNKEISIKNGLVAIYNYLNIKQKEFVDYGINLFNIMDNSRQKTSIEISLNDYLTKLFEKLDISFALNTLKIIVHLLFLHFFHNFHRIFLQVFH